MTWTIKIKSPLNEAEIMWECIGDTVNDIMNDYRESFPNGKWLNESIIRNSYLGRNKKDKFLIHIERN
tara:strand:+ start:773 stop:976 length:204 start_codon:yes stop_codon:yes gene_type:complete